MIPTWYFFVVAGVTGALVGSFLNVCIYRLPLEKSIVTPPSACPKCGKGIAFYDNIPVLSYLFLGGKCRHCRAGISLRYPFVEALNAAMWVGVLWRMGPSVAALWGMAFVSALIVVTFIDLDHQIIPDEISISMTPLGIIASSWWFPDAFGRSGILGWKMSLIGAATGFFLFYAIAVIGEKVFRKEAMGGGDIKLMAGIGAFLGPKGVLLTTFGGSLIGAVVGTIVLSIQGRDKATPIPFGPFLAGAAIVSLFFGAEIVNWYLGLHGR